MYNFFMLSWNLNLETHFLFYYCFIMFIQSYDTRNLKLWCDLGSWSLTVFLIKAAENQALKMNCSFSNAIFA